MDLCDQLEPDLMPAIRSPNSIPPTVQVMSVLHILATGSFQNTVALTTEMSQPMFNMDLKDVLCALLKQLNSYIRFPQHVELAYVEAEFYGLEHTTDVIGTIDGTHVALVPPSANEQGTAKQIIFVLFSAAANLIQQDLGNKVSGHMEPSLGTACSLTQLEESARHHSDYVRRGALLYKPKKVCQFTVASCLLHNLALRHHIPLLDAEEEEAVPVADEGDMGSDEEEDYEDAGDSRAELIRYYLG
ncbi:putative nuclease HARBI1 [Pleurodeles waltl]|uniref:putative nuclease HARBI1 n=1 Tax=Pleurodeles waltl TaxID=8319 RepID=UPI003709A04B